MGNGTFSHALTYLESFDRENSPGFFMTEGAPPAGFEPATNSLEGCCSIP